MKQSGTVIKNYNGYYYVSTSDGTVVACKLRGRFKQNRFSLLTGDKVIFTSAAAGESSIEEILPRVNSLSRPAIANVDQIVLVFSAKQPDFNQNVADRFLLLTEKTHLPVIICLNKIDLLTNMDEINKVSGIYQDIGYCVHSISAATGEGIDEMRGFLRGKTTVFAGLSGVGKSSLLNALYPGLERMTGAVSEKIGRGRHTTRYSELLAVNGAYIIDTPGFSLNETEGLSERELAEGFPEFEKYKTLCKFSTCIHAAEPFCAVKQAVDDGKINSIRYSNYLEMLYETNKGRRH